MTCWKGPHGSHLLMAPRALDAGIDKGRGNGKESEIVENEGGYACFEALRGPLSRGIQEAAIWVATAQESIRVGMSYGAAVEPCGSRCQRAHQSCHWSRAESITRCHGQQWPKGRDSGRVMHPSPWQNHLRACVPSTTLSPGTPVFPIYLPCLEMGTRGYPHATHGETEA